MRRLLALATLLLLLAGCTGTSSDSAPVLLFVTHERDGQQLAALVAVRETQEAGDAFTYLEDTETVLPGVPLALDVSGRTDERSKAVLLLGLPDGEFRVARFSLSGIDADAAGQLDPHYSDPVQALIAGSGGLLAEEDICLRDLQASADGQVLAFMSVPEDCDAANIVPPSILVLDTAEGTSRMVAGDVPLVTSTLFIRQRNEPEWNRDTLYYLEGADQVRLWSAKLPSGQPLQAGTFGAGSGSPEPLHLRMGTGRFLALQPDRLNLLMLPERDGEMAESSEKSDELRNAIEIVPDDYTDVLDAVVIRTADGLRIFPEASGTALKAPIGASSAATLHSDDRWVYAARNGQLTAVDLLELPEEKDSSLPTLGWRTVDGLGRVSHLTWFRSVLPPPGP